MAYSSVNPFNGELLKSFDQLTDKQLEQKLTTAENCYKTWKHTNYAERAKIIDKAAQLLRERAEEFAHTMALEMGKRIEKARGKVDVARDNPAFRDEFFGPVAMFFRVKDEDEAVALANDSGFGLGGSVFTQDIERGRRVASRVDTGMMFINNISWSAAELPFGGVKDSGYGRELGDMGIQEFVNKKLVRYAKAEAPA